MADEQAEWARAAGAGRARSRRALVRNGLIGAGILLALGAASTVLWWKEIGSKKATGASCSAGSECTSDALCFEGTCTPRCRSGSKCDPGLACVDVELETADLRGRYAGNADLCVPAERAPAIIESRQKKFQKPSWQ